VPRQPVWPPKIYTHKPSGRDRMRWQGVEYWLGPTGSAEADDRYRELIEQIRRGGSPAPTSADLLVEELVTWWAGWAPRNYRPDSREPEQFTYATEVFRAVLGPLPVRDLTPKKLRLVRDALGAKYCRNVANRHLVRIKTLLRTAGEEEVIPSEIYHRVHCVRPIETGAAGVRETAPVGPACWEDLEKALPFCPPCPKAMLELQAHSGCRSGEVRVVRTCDVTEVTPDLWHYKPHQHKGTWRGQVRIIPLGSKAIGVLKPWLLPDQPKAYVFSPRRSVAASWAARRAARKTPLTPSQRARDDERQATRLADFAEIYTSTAYPNAVARACVKAGVDFHPYQLRHTFKRRALKAGGQAAAQGAMGQKSSTAFDEYGGLDLDAAGDLARRIG
jgi:integrase